MVVRLVLEGNAPYIPPAGSRMPCPRSRGARGPVPLHKRLLVLFLHRRCRLLRCVVPHRRRVRTTHFLGIGGTPPLRYIHQPDLFPFHPPSLRSMNSRVPFPHTPGPQGCGRWSLERGRWWPRAASCAPGSRLMALCRRTRSSPWVCRHCPFGTMGGRWLVAPSWSAGRGCNPLSSHQACVGESGWWTWAVGRAWIASVKAKADLKIIEIIPRSKVWVGICLV